MNKNSCKLCNYSLAFVNNLFLIDFKYAIYLLIVGNLNVKYSLELLLIYLLIEPLPSFNLFGIIVGSPNITMRSHNYSICRYAII